MADANASFAGLCGAQPRMHSVSILLGVVVVVVLLRRDNKVSAHTCILVSVTRLVGHRKRPAHWNMKLMVDRGQTLGHF